MTHKLSKSTYLKGLQCEKSLYLNKHHKELKDKLTEAQEAIFSQGTMVGELAQDLFPGGLDVSPESFYDYTDSLQQTKDAIANGLTVIYEAAFQFDGVLCAVDILVRDGIAWKAYEVKSSTKVKEVNVQDASLQYHVLTNCGLQISDISLVVINNQYCKDGELDIHKLFRIESVLESVKESLAQTEGSIKRFKEVLAQKEVPAALIGKKCTAPYDCSFRGHCWKKVPDYSVFNLINIKKDKAELLYHSGSVLITDIPLDYRLSDSQALQVQCERDQSVIINKKKLREFVGELHYPLYFLDFESSMMAVPLFEHQKPYQQIPFQYSLHIQNSEEHNYLHLEFLAESDGGDPRLAFINQLIKDCGSEGAIVVYNKSFEKRILTELINDFPAYEYQLISIVNRMVDLMQPFLKKHYYTPAMKGKYSIKYVLPALCPELSYTDLDIKEGGSASRVFAQMLNKEFEGDLQQTRTALYEYCKLDTWAMVKILEQIKKVI